MNIAKKSTTKLPQQSISNNDYAASVGKEYFNSCEENNMDEKDILDQIDDIVNDNDSVKVNAHDSTVKKIEEQEKNATKNLIDKIDKSHEYDDTDCEVEKKANKNPLSICDSTRNTVSSIMSKLAQNNMNEKDMLWMSKTDKNVEMSMEDPCNAKIDNHENKGNLFENFGIASTVTKLTDNDNNDDPITNGHNSPVTIDLHDNISPTLEQSRTIPSPTTKDPFLCSSPRISSQPDDAPRTELPSETSSETSAYLAGT